MQLVEQMAIPFLQRWSVPLLRVALGIVFLWFGLLKLFGASPVEEMIRSTYSFFPTDAFMMVLGIWEVAIGLGLITKRFLRITLALCLLQMLGTLVAPVLTPSLFFNGNPSLLTSEGEFVVKNLVLIAAGLVIAGHRERI